MKHNLPLALACALPLAALALPAVAAPLGPIDAVRIAVERDPGLRAAGLRIREQQAAVTAAEGAFDLQLTSRLEYNTSRRTLTVQEDPDGDGPLPVQTARQRFDTRQGGFDIGLVQPLAWGTRIGLDFANDLTATDNPFQNCIPGLQSDECYETQLRLTLTQPLLRGFGSEVNIASIVQAETSVEAARLQQRQTAEALVATVIGAWAELAYASEAVAIRAQALELARQQLAATDAQIEVGRMAPADRPVVAQAVARRTRELAVAQLALADRRATLATYLALDTVDPAPFPTLDPYAGAPGRGPLDSGAGDTPARPLAPAATPTEATRPAGDPAPIESPVDAATGGGPGAPVDVLGESVTVAPPPSPFASTTYDTTYSTAESQSPDIALRVIERRRLKTNLAVYEDSGRPRLDLTLIAAQAGISDRYGDALAAIPDNDTHLYGAVLDFAWSPANNTAEGDIARTRRALEAVEAELDSLRETLRIEVGQAVRAAIAADTTLALDTEVATLAAEAVEAERKKFESGRATNLDVLQIQQELAEAQLAVARAEADRLVARVRVQQLTGALLDAYSLRLDAP